MGQGIQEWTMQNLRKTVFKVFQIFLRLSSTNFTRSILEYFDPHRSQKYKLFGIRSFAAYS